MGGGGDKMRATKLVYATGDAIESMANTASNIVDQLDRHRQISESEPQGCNSCMR
jgi:hypothetical protein